MAKPIFTLRLAWECEQHPTWELQTEHPGFSNWIAPALFANRATSPHPTSLDLAVGQVTLTLDTGAVVELAGNGVVLLPLATRRDVEGGMLDPRSLPGLAGIQLTAWHLPDDESELVVATCDSYRQLRGAAPPTTLSEAGLDGRWQPRSFEVLGPNGHVPLLLELDESGQFLSARMESARMEEEPPPGAGHDTAAISIIVKA